MNKKKVLFFLALLLSHASWSQFGLNTTVFSTKPITSKLTYEKDGVSVGDIFKVYYEKETNDGATKDVAVGYIMAHKIGSLTLKNNKTSIIFDGNTPLTVFKKIGTGNIEKGMEIKKMKRHWVSYGAEFSTQNNTFFSGPSLLATIKGATGALSFFIVGNLKFTTKDPINFNGVNKNYDINSLATIGLKAEKIVAFMNYFQFSLVGGGFGAAFNANNIGRSSLNNNYAAATGGPSWFGFGGLKLSLNAGPRVQFYVQHLYTVQISEQWEISHYGGSNQGSDLVSQLKGNINFKPNSMNFGIRIR